MATINSIEKIIKRFPAYKNLESQTNARYILCGVNEDKSKFPNFDNRLSEKSEYLAYLYLEVACTLFDAGNIEDAKPYFEKGASLLEYNHAASRKDNYSDFALMVCGLAYYCSCQYSKAFIVISRGQYNTNFTKLVYNFLAKRLTHLEDSIKESLLRDRDNKEWQDVFEILLARAMALVLSYFNYGKYEYIEQANSILIDARDLAETAEDPSIWWEFRLLLIIFSQIGESSLWGNLYNNSLFKVDNHGEKELISQLLDYLNINIDITSDWDKNARDSVEKYIYSLRYREKPITELFISQRKALEKVLMNESSVVSMPTSSGKTRIAEIVMLQSLLLNSSAKILYIAPFRSLAYEMEDTFSNSFSLLNMRVSHLYGGAQFTALDRTEMKDARILIVTPEKAKAILRSNDEIIENIELVVMDEGHLLGLGDREIANEMFTEELRRIVKQNKGKFIVLSAVLPNAQDMSIWLANKENRVVKNDWRPSDQRIGLLSYYPKRVDLEWQGEYPCFNKSFVEHRGDKKKAIALTALKLANLGAILIYCPQNRMIMSNANTMYSLIKEKPDVKWDGDDDWVKFSLICQESDEGRHYLELAKKGILCHFGNLDQDIRRYIEKLLRKGKAKFIYTTNTLAQGVNLGVSTIIIYGTYQDKDRYLPKSDFWNMAGRAGRSFIDTEGKILFVCDCSTKEEGHRYYAHEYIDNLVINKAESGVCKYLEKICKIQKESKIDLDYFLQLISEDNLAEISDKNRILMSNIFELIDDSLLALDIAYRDSEEDAADWVDDHFRNSLAVIQEEDELLREEHLKIIKARVKATRRLTQGNNIPQTFASSGIPIKTALYLEEKMNDIIVIADEYLESFLETDAIIIFFQKFDDIMDNLDSKRINVLDSDIREEEMEHWLRGETINGKNGTKVRQYYSFTISWILNAIANRFSFIDDVYKNFFESMSLIANYGLPSKWAVQIYLCGIHSRLSATEVSKQLNANSEFYSLSDVATFLKSHSDRIITNEHCSDLTKGWVRVLIEEKRSDIRKVAKLSNFHFSNSDTDKPELLFCKKYNGNNYLCSEDMQYKTIVTDEDDLHFSDIADIPGIFFRKENGSWKMQNVNPYIEIE